MSPDELMRAWYEQVWNKGNSRFIHQHMANPCRIKGLPNPPETPEQFEQFQRGMLANIKNTRVEVLDSLESGTKTIGICRVTGIDVKTNQPVEFHFAYSGIVENDKIVEAHNVVDFLSYLQQTNSVSPMILAEKFA